MYNALTFKQLNNNCTKANIVVANKDEFKKLSIDKRVISYQLVDENFNGMFFSKHIYLSSLSLHDGIMDAVIENVLGAGSKIIIDTARTLTEVGLFDAKKGASPIMYAHKLGLLTNASIAGGVYLDKDDVDLMVQESAELILTPAFDAGVGNGIPLYKMYLDRGLAMHLGTMDNSFNLRGCVDYEKELLRLLVNGSMCQKIL